MRKIKKLGKKLAIFTIVLAFIVVFLGLMVFNKWWNNRGILPSEEISKENEQNISNLQTVKAEDIYIDTNNYWAKSIIKEVVNEDVPIPQNMEYVSGTKDTGVIVKDNDTGIQLMWIPYDETVTEDLANDYYTNCDYEPMDVDTKESIEHYGGFFVTLESSNMYDTLKNVDNNSYMAATTNATKIFEESDSVSSHLLYKYEIAQIEAYGNKIGKQLIKTGMKNTDSNKLNIVKVAESQEDTTEENVGVIGVNPDTYEASEETGSYIIEYTVENNVEKVVIPGGFDKCTKNVPIAHANANQHGLDNFDEKIVVKIQDQKNPNLRYVWIPVNDLDNCSKLIKEQYDEQNQNFYYNSYQSINNDTYQQLLESVKQYGGFYIAEAELGVNSDGKVTNKGRGMNVVGEDSVQVNTGDYYRGTTFKTYDAAVSLASDVHKENNNVVSHLMYGTEYDAAILWLYSTGGVTAEQLVKDSSSVIGAKYQGTYENKTLSDTELQGINGIYGLAGNLVELTQELVEYEESDGTKSTYVVARGGSYLYPGSQFSMASRITLTNDYIQNCPDVGIRNCLFLDKDAIENEKFFEINDDGAIKLRDEYLPDGKNASQMVETLEIPSTLGGKTVKSIAKNGFKGCKTLKNIVLPESLEEIKSEAFNGCESLETVSFLSEQVKTIGMNAFANCKSLTRIEIPSSVTNIDTTAFNGCSNLTEIIFVGEQLPKLEGNTKTFENVDKIKVIYVLDNMSEEEKQKLYTFFSENIQIKTIVAYDVVENQVNQLLPYAEGYIYGNTNNDAWQVKVDTGGEILDYYDQNKILLNRPEMEEKLTEIRQSGEKKIEDILQQYRDNIYNTQVEGYITEWHPDISSEEWVINLKNEVKDKIQYENNMNNVDTAAQDFQIQIEEKVNTVNSAKTYYINIINNYVPYVGWDYGSYWINGMNEIKRKYINQISSAKDEEEVKKLQIECESEIENYVNPTVKQKAKEAAEAEQARREAAKKAKASASSSRIKNGSKNNKNSGSTNSGSTNSGSTNSGSTTSGNSSGDFQFESGKDSDGVTSTGNEFWDKIKYTAYKIDKFFGFPDSWLNNTYRS